MAQERTSGTLPTCQMEEVRKRSTRDVRKQHARMSQERAQAANLESVQRVDGALRSGTSHGTRQHVARRLEVHLCQQWTP